MWEKIKSWIIHKLGGKTQKEYDTGIKNFKAEYDMTHPTGIRYIDRYPQKEIFRYDFTVPDRLVFDTDEFRASEESRKIREDIIFEIAKALFDGDHVHFEECRDLLHYEKKMRATLCVLK